MRTSHDIYTNSTRELRVSTRKLYLACKWYNHNVDDIALQTLWLNHKNIPYIQSIKKRFFLLRFVLYLNWKSSRG